MSLILEALRKSEAERRRGDTPGLAVELPPVAPPGRRGVPAAAWIAAAALAAVVALVLLWPDAPGERAAAGAARGTATDVPAEPPPAAGSPAATAPTASTDLPPVERIQPQPAAPRDLPTDMPLAPPPMATRAAEEAAADARAASTIRDAARPPAPTPAPASAAAPAPAPASAPPGPEPASASTPVPAAPPASTATAADPPPLRLSSLPTGQRQRLPEMKLSLHMWNHDPARRFAVIDGQRRVEGDRIGDATITAIDRDGVLLELDGQAVRVPLP